MPARVRTHTSRALPGCPAEGHTRSRPRLCATRLPHDATYWTCEGSPAWYGIDAGHAATPKRRRRRTPAKGQGVLS
jgi:hypothetical protein